MIPLRDLLAAPTEDWRELAACRGKAPADGTRQKHPFFPKDGLVPDDLAQLCSGCPVRRQCEADRSDAAGIWAGEFHSGRCDANKSHHRKAAERRGSLIRAHRLRGLGWSIEAIVAEVGRGHLAVRRLLNEHCDSAGCWCGIADTERRAL